MLWHILDVHGFVRNADVRCITEQYTLYCIVTSCLSLFRHIANMDEKAT